MSHAVLIPEGLKNPPTAPTAPAAEACNSTISMARSDVWRSCAADCAGHLRQVIIAGRKGAEDTEALLDAAHAVYCPDKACI